MISKLQTSAAFGVLLGAATMLGTAGCDRGSHRRTPALRRPSLPASASGPIRCAAPLSEHLARGDYVRFVASQSERDVTVTLSDAEGKTLLKVDSLSAHPGAPWPDEELHWIASRSGTIRAEAWSSPPPSVATDVLPLGDRPNTSLGGAEEGCSLRRSTLRSATRADRNRVAAELALTRAHAERLAGEASACAAAPHLYERAAAELATLHLPARTAEALFGLGLTELNCRPKGRAALAAFDRALPYFVAAGDQRSEAQAHQRIGERHFALGELDAALRHYRAALALFRRSAERSGEAAISSDLGHALHLQGHYDEAAHFFDQALTLWPASGDPAGWATTLLNRGQLHRQLGHPGAARSDFRNALALARRARVDLLEGQAQNALGVLGLEEGHPEAALTALRQALARRTSGSRGQAVTLNTLGVAYSQLGRRAQANGRRAETREWLDAGRRAYRQALAIFERERDSREQVRSLTNLGWLEAQAGALPLARHLFARALAQLATSADPPSRAEVLSGLAWVDWRANDLESARRGMLEAVAEVELQRSRQPASGTRAAFFSTQQSHYDLLIELLMEMHRRAPHREYDAEALAVNERAQARSLLDALARAGTLPIAGALAKLARRERLLEGALDSLAARETSFLAAGAHLAQVRLLAAERERVWGELTLVRAALRASAPHYAALTQPKTWNAAQIRNRLLDRDTLLLEIRLGSERSFLWALTAGGLTSVALPPRAELEPAAALASELLAGSYSQAAEISAALKLAALSKILLGPIAQLLPGKRLLVVADGSLRTLPFAALPDPNGGEPLIAGHEIVSLPSASVLGELRRTGAGRTPPPKTLWILANPDLGEDGRFLPLRHALAEAEALANLVPPARREQLVGVAASRDAVLRTPLRDYRLLHFATHGWFTTAGAAGGSLVLAQRDRSGRPLRDGFLQLADLYGLDLRADLVTLSACESGLGTELPGEGLIGMTRGFLYAGAERVLVSLWNVNDLASVALMERFYAAMLRQGLSPAAALRLAQNAIRAQTRWRAPYFWAAFSLQGEWLGSPTAPKPPRASRDLGQENGPNHAPRRTQ